MNDSDIFYANISNSPSGPSRPVRTEVETQTVPGKRAKYAAQACWDCHQRKVKCSGEDPCSQCRARDVTCTYFSRSERGGRKSQPDNTSSNAAGSASAIESAKTNPQHSKTAQSQTNKRKPAQAEAPSATSSDSRRKRGKASPSDPEIFEELDNIPIADHRDVADTYDLHLHCSNSISLSSQLISLTDGANPNFNSELSPLSSNGATKESPFLSLQLPTLARFQAMTEIFFKEMNNFLPILSQDIFVPRIAQLLRSAGYNERTGTVSFRREHARIFGIVCNILAIAEAHAPDMRVESGRSGWNWFQHGLRIVQHADGSDFTGLDPVYYYTLSAEYLLHSELMSYASSFIMQAWNAATACGLNQQSSWPRGVPGSAIVARQKLWWSLYFLDAHISRRRGRPYLIHDNEVAVSEFLPRLSIVKIPEFSKLTSVHEHLLALSNAAMRDLEYCQFLINFSHLWRQIWDTLFSARLSGQTDAQDVELLDTRILFMEKLRSPLLAWEGNKRTHEANADDEIQTRYRLYYQLLLNLFRMIIRQNPLRKSQPSLYDRKLCAQLASNSISTCASFISTYPDMLRPGASLLTSNLTESLYHLTCALRDGDGDVDPKAGLESFKTAFGLIKFLAQNFYAARKALVAITMSYSSLTSATSVSSPMSQLVDFVSRETATLSTESWSKQTAANQNTNDFRGFTSPNSTAVNMPEPVDKEASTESEVAEPLKARDLNIPWPFMGDFDPVVMETLAWPDLEFNLGRDMFDMSSGMQ